MRLLVALGTRDAYDSLVVATDLCLPPWRRMRAEVLSLDSTSLLRGGQKKSCPSAPFVKMEAHNPLQDFFFFSIGKELVQLFHLQGSAYPPGITHTVSTDLLQSPGLAHSVCYPELHVIWRPELMLMIFCWSTSEHSGSMHSSWGYSGGGCTGRLSENLSTVL